jgi:phosphorylase kinase alpha/beta subunit
LFFTYLILDGLFFGDMEQAEHYRAMIEPLLVNSNTVELYSNTKSSDNGYESEEDSRPMRLVPELYIVPKESIEAERSAHGTQERVPNQNVPLVWAQSLHIMGKLIHDGLLSVADVDPLGRRLASSSSRSSSDTVVQIVLLAETEELQAKLLMHGLQSHTIQNCEPITISKPSCLRDAYTFLGKNEKLGLSGRPNRPMGTLSTCKIYRCQGQLYAFLPHFMDKEEFYLVSDNDYLVSLFEQEVSSVRNLWMQNGRPTMVVMLTKQMIGQLHGDSPASAGRGKDMSKRNLLNFLISIGSSGICQGTRVRVGRLSEMVNTACVESLDFLVGQGSDSQQDWGSILAGRESKFTAQKLKASYMDGGDREAQTLHLHTKGRSIRTLKKDNIEDAAIAPLKSPLARSLGYPGEMEDLDLLELESNSDASDATRQRMSPSSISEGKESKPLALVLGNPSQSKEAIQLLSTCTNLYDQMDLLHYLYSCHGGDYPIPGLASLRTLLEEVYWKAMHVRQWSVVRHAAGVLRKTVNSLTSNLADLLIRQRPVTIGIKPKEYFIDSPKNPAALAQIIFDHW